MAAATDGGLKSWRRQESRWVEEASREWPELSAVDRSGDGSLLAVGDRQGNVSLVRATDFEIAKTWKVDETAVRHVRLSPDGRTLVCSSSGILSTIRG